MELNKYILRKAIAVNICEEWKAKLLAVTSIDDMLKMYVEGIDFCLSNNFPSNKDLLTFGSDFINQYGIYINSTVKLTDRKFIVLLGNCNAMLKLTEFNVCQLFVKEESNVMISISDNSYLVIDCFDNSNLTLNATGESRALINVYGNAKINATGNFRIELKNKETY